MTNTEKRVEKIRKIQEECIQPEPMIVFLLSEIDRLKQPLIKSCSCEAYKKRIKQLEEDLNSERMSLAIQKHAVKVLKDKVELLTELATQDLEDFRLMREIAKEQGHVCHVKNCSCGEDIDQELNGGRRRGNEKTNTKSGHGGCLYCAVENIRS